MWENTCKVCGTKFYSKVKNKRYCNIECKYAAYNTTRRKITEENKNAFSLFQKEEHRQPVRRVRSDKDPNLELKIVSAMAKHFRTSYSDMAQKIDSGEQTIWSVPEFESMTGVKVQ